MVYKVRLARERWIVDEIHGGYIRVTLYFLRGEKVVRTIDACKNRHLLEEQLGCGLMEEDCVIHERTDSNGEIEDRFRLKRTA
jgi:hypothetical protein